MHAAAYALHPVSFSVDIYDLNDGEIIEGFNIVLGRFYFDDPDSLAAATSQFTDFRLREGVFALPAVQAMMVEEKVLANPSFLGNNSGASQLRKAALRILSKSCSASQC
jgi:hypothetical protein